MSDYLAKVTTWVAANPNEGELFVDRRLTDQSSLF